MLLIFSCIVCSYISTSCVCIHTRHVSIPGPMQGYRCAHTSLHTRCLGPYPQNSRWYICQQTKSCWKINYFTSRPRLIDFSIMAILHFGLLRALGHRFPPFFRQASLSGNKWHQYLDNTSFMIAKMAFLTLSLALKTTLARVCCWHVGSFRSTLIDTDCFIDKREYNSHISTHVYTPRDLSHTRVTPDINLSAFVTKIRNGHQGNTGWRKGEGEQRLPKLSPSVKSYFSISLLIN